MPTSAPRPCRRPGCKQLVAGGDGFCDAHRQAKRREVDGNRESAARRGYGRKWQAAREAFLREHPLCQCPDCDEGRVRLLAATVVDHVIPHKGDLKLFWNRRNWMAMSKPCHDRKTARSDGGFGRDPGVAESLGKIGEDRRLS